MMTESAVAYPDNVRELLELFEFSHLPEHLQEVSRDFHGLARKTAERAPRHPETVFALHELLRAKDSAVRAALAEDRRGTAA